MNEYRVKLIAKKEIARDTLLFQFEKPRNFKFIAGQFGVWTLPQLSPKVEKGNNRYFTIASPPYFKHLEIAMRDTGSPFKDALKSMKTGKNILFYGPQGNFVLQRKTRKPGNKGTIAKVVFLCGGIGITPARSMILQVLHDKAPFKFYLFYSNNTPGDAAFLEEFIAFSSPRPLKKDARPRFLFVPTMTATSGLRGWNGERGFIDISMLKRYLPNIKKPLYYVSGPPGFVEAMQTMLDKAGVEKEAIHLDRFVGYN